MCFDGQIISDLANESPFRLISVFSNMSLDTILEHFLVFWHKMMFQAYLVFSLAQPWNHSFRQETLVLFSGNSYSEAKTWVMSVLLPLGRFCFQTLSVDTYT